MSDLTCGHLWQVEAHRDGRLNDALVREHLAHVASCPACTAEARALVRLGESLRAAGGHAEDALPVALRDEVLRRGNDRMARGAGERSGSGRRAAGVALAFVVLAAGVLGAARVALPPPETPAARVRLVGPGALFVETHRDGEHRVVLRDGVLDVSVGPPRDGAERLLIDVPDGVIEDIGTEFSVRVSNGVTRSIRVLRGAVVFHRPPDADVRLEAHQVWQRAPLLDPAPEAASSVDPPSVPRKPAALGSGAGLSPSRAVGVVKPAPDVRDGEPTDPAGRSPQDTVAEDAAYLHIVALLREGRREEARLSGRAYLQQYPQGFRRREVDRISE